MTGWGQIWNVNHFVLRLFLLTVVGDELYDDEMSSFICDTSQPGCRNVCFNKFSPMSVSRFWAAHVLFTALPVLAFYKEFWHEKFKIQLWSRIRKGVTASTSEKNICEPGNIFLFQNTVTIILQFYDYWCLTAKQLRTPTEITKYGRQFLRLRVELKNLKFS